MPTMTASQRFSVRATISGGTMPSGSGRSRKSGCVLANGASREEQEEIEGKPPQEQERYRDRRDEKRATRAVPERFQGSLGVDRLGNVVWRGGGRVISADGRFEHRRPHYFATTASALRICW